MADGVSAKVIHKLFIEIIKHSTDNVILLIILQKFSKEGGYSTFFFINIS